jgi:hypothetical protein
MLRFEIHAEAAEHRHEHQPKNDRAEPFPWSRRRRDPRQSHEGSRPSDAGHLVSLEGEPQLVVAGVAGRSDTFQCGRSPHDYHAFEVRLQG